MPSDIREQLIHTIMKTFSYNKKQANNLFKELLMCVKERDLVTIFFFCVPLLNLKTSIFLRSQYFVWVKNHHKILI
jgi:hypothetical protein